MLEENSKEDILEIYETLIDNGVTFYYGSESIETGEITELEILENNIMQIELDGYQVHEISIDDFMEYHSKEGANYHTWPDIRMFDKKLFEMQDK